MIFYVVTSRFSSTIRRLIRGLGRETNGLISFVTYEELFFERAAYLGHYVFTDFDRLSRYETDCAAAVAIALQEAAPELKILNHPLEVQERFSLLDRLYRAGLNDFPVHRLDSDQRPTAYPTFIRAEDGYGGPESGLIEDERQFESALVDFSRRGLPLKGRIAVGYVGERDFEGFHRKYGAFNIGGAIIPQHLMRGDDWVVKKNSSRNGAQSIDEELSYVRDNPHAEHLSLAFRIGGIQFGRVDYGFYRGKPQVYEINTNPSFPNFMKNDSRNERRLIIRTRILEALRVINSPHSRGRIRIPELRPRAHDLRLPGQRLPISLFRRAVDRLTGRASMPGGGFL